MNWVDAHPELLQRFIFHLSSISVSNVFRKLLDATDRQPPSSELNDTDDDTPPGPKAVNSSFEMSALSGDDGRRILWQGKLGDGAAATTTTTTTTAAGGRTLDAASMCVVSTILNVFNEPDCEDDKYVSAGDALIDCVNRSTAQETILSLQSDEPPRNTPTDLMSALNTTQAARALMAAAVSPTTAKCAVQGCLSVLVRLIEWHAQNLQFEADERLPTETMSDDEDSDKEDAPAAAEAKTPRGSAQLDTFKEVPPLLEPLPLPQLVAEVVVNMPTLMEGLLKHPDVPDRRFSNKDTRKPFGLVRLQAVELFTHMVYVRHQEVATCMKNHRVILKCLDYCFEYELNNTLHGLVAQAVASMCEEFDLATTVDDYSGLFISVNNQPNLLDVVLNAYENSDALESTRGYNACYMGHLHIIANTIHESSIKCAQMMEQLEKNSGDSGDSGGGTDQKAGPGLAAQLALQLDSEDVAQRTASMSSLETHPLPEQQFSNSALEVARLIVEACATNARWITFVNDRLPQINDKQRDAPLGGEDAERESSLASPRVTGIQLSDMLDGDVNNEISNLDLGLASNSGVNDENDENVLSFDRGDLVVDSDEEDSDDEEMDETDPVSVDCNRNVSVLDRSWCFS